MAYYDNPSRVTGMLYDGSRPQLYPPRNNKIFDLGVKTFPSYGHAPQTPPRTDSSELDMPPWSVNGDVRQTSNHGSFGDGKIANILAFRRQDTVAKHLLIETALLDSQNFELCSMEEVDALKLEKKQLEFRLEGARRKLALESKVKEAAQSLHRLYYDGDSVSPVKSSFGFLGTDKSRSSNQPKANQAADELITSQKKIDDLMQILSGLENRRQYVESRLLRHTSAVLQLAYQEQAKGGNIYSPSLPNGTIGSRDVTNSDYEESIFSRFTSGAVSSLSSISSLHKKTPSVGVPNEKLVALQSRLDGMNTQIRTLIRTIRGERMTINDDSDIVASIPQSGGDTITQIDNQLQVVDKNFQRLEEECTKVADDGEVTKGRLTDINKQLYLLLQVAEASENKSRAQLPPTSKNAKPYMHLDYLQTSLSLMEQIVQAKNIQSSTLRDGVEQKLLEYETTIHSLWENLIVSGDDDEAFNLQSFNTRVQHILERSAHMDAQTDILRRQIQQQRELNSKSDGDKDRQLKEAQMTKDRTDNDMAELRRRAMTAETDLRTAQNELDKVSTEASRFKGTVSSNESQKREVLEQIEQHKARSQNLGKQVSMLQDELHTAHSETDLLKRGHAIKIQGLSKDLNDAQSSKDAAHGQIDNKQKEVEDLETQVAQLRTEVTMARAELESAYGSRADRAKQQNTEELIKLRNERDLQSQEIQQLQEQLRRSPPQDNSRLVSMQRELAATAAALEDLTRESIAVEKERSQFEALVDDLRSRCDRLEAQLADEKVKGLGASSPSIMSFDGSRETTGTAMLKSEFKRMMREMRTEHARVLKVNKITMFFAIQCELILL